MHVGKVIALGVLLVCFVVCMYGLVCYIHCTLYFLSASLITSLIHPLPPSLPPSTHSLPLCLPPPTPSLSASLHPLPPPPRLRSQLAEKEADMKDTASSLQSKHQAEIQGLKEILATTETTNTDLQKEVRGQ